MRFEINRELRLRINALDGGDVILVIGVEEVSMHLNNIAGMSKYCICMGRYLDCTVYNWNILRKTMLPLTVYSNSALPSHITLSPYWSLLWDWASWRNVAPCLCWIIRSSSIRWLSTRFHSTSSQSSSSIWGSAGTPDKLSYFPAGNTVPWSWTNSGKAGCYWRAWRTMSTRKASTLCCFFAGIWTAVGNVFWSVLYLIGCTVEAIEFAVHATHIWHQTGMVLPVQNMKHRIIGLMGRHYKQQIAGDEVEALAVSHLREG